MKKRGNLTSNSLTYKSIDLILGCRFTFATLTTLKSNLLTFYTVVNPSKNKN